MDTEVREVLTFDDLADAWHVLAPEDRAEGFRLLPRAEAEDFFLARPARDQAELLRAVPPGERRAWARLLAPDDAADLVQEVEPEERERVLALLDEQTRLDVRALLAYAEDAAGGLMSPRYARLRPEMTVDEAIIYLRKQARERLETIYYVYVLDEAQRLLGVVSFRDLFAAPPGRLVARRDAAPTRSTRPRRPGPGGGGPRLHARPATSRSRWWTPRGGSQGIVTLDDIVDVVEEEATEDIQKIGGMEALGAPYLQIGFRQMIGEARRLARRALPRRDAHRHRHGPLRGRDRAGGGPRAVRAAHHLERRQLGLAGVHARHPRDGARRGAAARLVAGRCAASSPRASCSARSSARIGFLRIVVWQAVRPHLRRALPADRAHRRARA